MIGKRDGRRASPGAPRLILRKCFICQATALSLDKEPPFRCNDCYARILANEMDGELDVVSRQDDDCEDQALAPVEHCVALACAHAGLTKKGDFWVCSRCGASYGENPF